MGSPIDRHDVKLMMEDALRMAGMDEHEAQRLCERVAESFLRSLLRAMMTRGVVKVYGFMTGRLRKDSARVFNLRITMEEEDGRDGVGTDDGECAVDDFTAD